MRRRLHLSEPDHWASQPHMPAQQFGSCLSHHAAQHSTGTRGDRRIDFLISSEDIGTSFPKRGDEGVNT